MITIPDIKVKNIGDHKPFDNPAEPESAIKNRASTKRAKDTIKELRTPILSETPPRRSIAKVIPPVKKL
jgi:hypothetical protein